MGVYGTGAVYQTGGTHDVGALELGFMSGSIGSYTVSDSGVLSAVNIRLGFQGGTGNLSILSGGQATVGGVLEIGSNGTITVNSDSPSSPALNAYVLTVGSKGTGTLNIERGTVSSDVAYLGDLSAGAGTGTGTGTVNVNGYDASWEIGSSFYVGRDSNGTGTLNVNGGTVTTGNSPLWVGEYGTGYINITYGGELNTGGIVIIGAETGSAGDVTVDGVGSSWTSNGTYFDVGRYGDATLNIINSGTVTTNGNSATIGGLASGIVTVDGLGSTWTQAGYDSTNISGLGIATLDIINGGTVTAYSTNSSSSAVSMKVGVGNGRTGTVAVDGIDSVLNVNRYFDIGSYGGDGSLTITNGGTVNAASSQIARNTWQGNGSTGTVIVNGAGSTWNNSGSLYVGGDQSAAAVGSTGILNVQNGGTVTVDGDFRIWESGTVNADSSTDIDVAGTLTVDGIYSIDNVSTLNGTWKGSGTIEIPELILAGILAPGNSPGTMNIFGDYTQLAGGELMIEIGGLLAGSEYDVLDISGTATLGGTLDISLYDFGSGLFNPQAGDSFDILLADTIAGEFDLLTLAILDTGLSWELDYLTDAIGSTDIVQLSVVSAVPVPPAAWLFGSGLLGLIGISKRKKVA